MLICQGFAGNSHLIFCAPKAKIRRKGGMKKSHDGERRRCAACGKFLGDCFCRRGGQFCCNDPGCIRKLKIEYDRKYRKDFPDTFLGRYPYIKEWRANRRKVIQVKNASAKPVNTAFAGDGLLLMPKNGVIQVFSRSKLLVGRVFPGDGNSPIPRFAGYKYELPLDTA